LLPFPWGLTRSDPSPGVVTKMKMQRTIVIRRDYLHYIRKYNRFEKRHKNMSVHLSPCFR
jgi:small subunit ribosomal protein S11e